MKSLRDDPKPLNRFKARVYPSTAVPGVITKKNQERPKLTPDDMKMLVSRFNATKPELKPRLRWEHSAAAKNEIGLITKASFNEKDKWLYMHGHIYDGLREEMGQIFSHGRFSKGVSLCYYRNQNDKNFIEISLTHNPDFEDSRVIKCHSASSEEPAYPINTEVIDIFAHFANITMQVSDDFVPDQHIFQLDDGGWMVTEESHVDLARKHAISLGKDPAIVTFADSSEFDNIDKKDLARMTVVLRQQNERNAQRIIAEEQRRKEEKARAAHEASLSAVMPFADSLTFGVFDTDQSKKDQVKRELAEKMVSDDHVRVLGVLHNQQVSALKKEIEELRSKRPAVPPMIAAHGASDTRNVKPRSSFASTTTPVSQEPQKLSLWDQLAARFLSTSSTTPSSSPSSSSHEESEIHQHSGPDPHAEKLAQLRWRDFSIFDGTPVSTTGVMIMQHSSSSSSSSTPQPRRSHVVLPDHLAGFVEKTLPLSRQTVTAGRKAETLSILAGVLRNPPREVPATWLTNNYLTCNPEVFMCMIDAHNTSEVPTNTSARTLGFDQGGTCGLSPTMLARVNANPQWKAENVLSPADFFTRALRYAGQ